MINLLFQQRPHGGHGLLSHIGHWGAGGLFVVAIIDSLPIPTFAGPDILIIVFAASRRDLWWEYATVATAGAVVGAYLTFRLARKAGQAYLDKKFQKKKVDAVLKIYRRWGAGALFASCAVPFPFPTGVLFAAAGVSKYRLSKFLPIVLLGRGMRYVGIAILAAYYGRHVMRVIRHPGQYWGWLLLLIVLVAGLVTAFVLFSRRLGSARAPSPQERKAA